MLEIPKNNFIEAKTSRMYLLENNIVFIEEKPGIDVTLEDAIANSKIANQIRSEGKCGLLIDARHQKSMTKEARDYYAQKDTLPGCAGMAILVESYFSKVIANFFISFSKPEFPTQLFTSEEEAIAWLKSFLE